MAKFVRDHPLRGRQMQVKWVKIGHFQRTRGSAIAEGLYDALVSKNSATTQDPISKLESRAYRVALFP